MENNFQNLTSTSEVSNHSTLPILPLNNNNSKNNNESDSDTIAMKPISVRANVSNPQNKNGTKIPKSSCCLLL